MGTVMFIANSNYLESFKNALYFAIYEEYDCLMSVLDNRIGGYTLIKSVIFYKITGKYLPEDPYSGRFDHNFSRLDNGLFCSIKVDEKYIKDYKNYKKNVVHILKNYVTCDFLLKALDNHWTFNIISYNGFITEFYVIEDEYKQTYIQLRETETSIFCNEDEILKYWVEPKTQISSHIEDYMKGVPIDQN